MTTSEFATLNVENGDYLLPDGLAIEETALPLILVNLQDSFSFLIEQVNPLEPLP